MRHDPDNLRPLEGTALCTWPTCGCTDSTALAVCPDYSVTHGMRARINAGHAPEGRGGIRCVLIGGAIGLSLYPMSWGAAMLIQYIGGLW